MSITLNVDDEVLASLPLAPGERERPMQIELACRFYAKGWLTLGQAAKMAGLDHYAFGVQLAERGIPRQYGMTEALEQASLWRSPDFLNRGSGTCGFDSQFS